jgi:DNA-binding transcriptional regulator YiaG
MPNIAALLKEEMSRLARKELRKDLEGVKKGSAQYRRDIAELKRQVTGLQRQVALLEGRVLKDAPAPAAADAASEARERFTAKGLRSQRTRLGLSAADYGTLVGVTGQSIGNWERGTTSPRKEQVANLVSLRGLGKKEARARLQALTKQESSTKKKPISKKKPAIKKRAAAKKKS